MKGKTFRKCIALFLALTMTLSVNVTGFAAEAAQPANIDAIEVVEENIAPQSLDYINVGSGIVYDPANPNYVPEGAEVDLSDDVVAQLKQTAEDICVSAANSGSKKADVVFVIDTTGSMYDEITSVKKNLSEFVNYMSSKGMTVRFGIITYRDITCDGIDSTVVFKSGLSGSTWYTSATDTIEAINGISVDGGGDIEETLYDALGYLTDGITYNWSSNATRCSIVLTDADSKSENRWDGSYVVKGAYVEETSDVAMAADVSATVRPVSEVMTDFANRLAERHIVTSVITSSYYYEHYSPLIEITSGVLGDIYGDIYSVLINMADNIIKFSKDEHIGVYVIPGYLGSQLYLKDSEDNAGDKMWIGASKLFSDWIDSVLKSDTEIGSEGTLADNKNLTVDPTDDLYGTQDTYKNLIEYLNTTLPDEMYSVKFFPYNWLGDINDAEKALEEDIEASGYSSVILVTHSTGGLLASAYLAKPANQLKVKKAILVAPPLYGTYTALEPLEFGNTAAINKTITSAVTAVLAAELATGHPAAAVTTAVASVGLVSLTYKYLKGSVKNSPTTYQLLPSLEYLKIIPVEYFKTSGPSSWFRKPVVSMTEYYDNLRNSQGKLNSDLLDGSNNSHKYFRDTVLNGDVREILNQVDTTIIGSSYNGKASTPAYVSVSRPFSALWSDDTHVEVVYKKDGDGTVLGISGLLKPVPGDDADDNINRIDMVKKIDTTKKSNYDLIGHTDLVKEDLGIKTIAECILAESDPDDVKWSGDDLYTEDTASLDGMTDSVKIFIQNNQPTFVKVLNEKDEVVAEISSVPANCKGFGEVDGFYYYDLSEADAVEYKYFYQLIIPNGGYKLEVYNSTDVDPQCQVAVATMDRDGNRKETATYSAVTADEEKLITSFDLTKAVTSETVKTIETTAEFKGVKTAKNDWSIEESILLTKIGETKTIKFEGKDAEDAKAHMDWYSSDPEIVSVDENGVVKALKYGEATIYATSTEDAGKTDACVVKVGLYPEAIEIDDFTMYVGKRVKPDVIFTPENANMRKVTYESEDRNIVKVINKSTLVGVSEGTVKVIGTSENGKTAEFVVTVISPDALYVDDVHIDPAVAVLPADSTSTITAKIVPETALNKKVNWTIEDDGLGIATLTEKTDNSVEIKGIREGVARLSALTDDGSYSDESYIVVGSVVDINENNRMVMPVGKSKQLVLGNGSKYYPITTGTSSDEEVVSVSANGAIYAAKPGSSVVTFEGALKGERVVTSLQVDVVSSLTDVVKNVYLESTEVTSNVYLKESGSVRVLIDLDTEAKLAPDAQSIAMAIQDAKFTDSTVASMFDLAPISDSVLKIRPKMALTDAAVKALAKAYESSIDVTIDGKTFTTAAKVKINIDKKKAKVKVNPVTVNTYFSSQIVKIPATTSVGSITEIKIDPATASKVPANIKINESECAINYIGGELAKSNNFNVLVYVDSLREPVSLNLVVKAKSTAPKFKLSSASVKVYKNIKYNVGQNITLKAPGKSTLEDYQVASVTIANPESLTEAEAKKYTINNEYKITGFDSDDGVFRLIPSSADGVAKTGTLLLRIHMYGTTDTVTVPLKVTATDQAKLSLKKGSLTFNKNFLGHASYSVGYTVTPADYSQSDLKIKVLTNASNNKGADASEDIGVTMNNNMITVSPKNSASLNKYKISIGDGNISKDLNVSIKSYRYNQYGIKISTSKKVDIADPDGSGVIVKVGLKNILANKSSITFTPYVYRYKGKYSSTNVSSAFKCVNQGNGTFKVCIDRESSLYKNGEIKDGYTYKLGGYAYVGGYSAGYISKYKKINVSSSKKKMSASAKEIGLTDSNKDIAVPITVRIDGIDPSVYSFEASGTDVMKFCTVENKGDGTFYVTLTSGRTNPGASGTLTIKAKAKGSSKVVASAKIKVRYIN